jgi:hypothetical protein
MGHPQELSLPVKSKRPGVDARPFPFLTYILSIRDWVKLICYAGRSFISFRWWVVAAFAQIWGLDKILAD